MSVKRRVTVPAGRSSRMRQDHPPARPAVQSPYPTPGESVERWGLLGGYRVVRSGDELINLSSTSAVPWSCVGWRRAAG
jgi:hypothetical protein